MKETANLREEELNEPSRRLLSEIGDHPSCGRANLLMERRVDGSWSLMVKIPSPTGDRRRNVSLWLDENLVPSLEFGGWHTHADLWDGDLVVGLRRMLDHLECITDGRIVLVEDPLDPQAPPTTVLNLDDEAEVLDALTAPATLESRLLSWSGAEDSTLDELRKPA